MSRRPAKGWTRARSTAVLGGFAVVALNGLAGCTDDVPPEPAWPRSAVADVDAVVDRWLSCTECTEGQLRAVVAAGPAAVPRLARLLLSGPDASEIQEHERYLNAAWSDLRADAAARGASFAISQADFTTLFQDAYATERRIRAAHALRRIGSAEAIAALQDALAAGPPQPVADAITAALQPI